MVHHSSLGQTVMPTVYGREPHAVCEVIWRLPKDGMGAAQCRLRNTATGVEIMSREPEI